MRNALVLAWVLVPAVAVAYHYGPGQDRLRADDAAALVRKGADSAARAREVAAKDGDAAARDFWTESEAAYADAIPLLDGGSPDAARAARLERAKAWMNIGKLPEARQEFERLVDDAAADPSTDPALLADARGSLAESRFYMTWLLRLEGYARDVWGPEIDAARQSYKLLHEDAVARADDAAATRSRESLEAAVRLERLDLTELQGLPLPSQ